MDWNIRLCLRKLCPQKGSRRHPGIGPAILFLFCVTWLLSACGGQPFRAPESEPIATGSSETANPAATPSLALSTPAPTETPAGARFTATPTFEPAASQVEPDVTAPAIRLESWSPDGQWLSFWASTPEDVASDFYPFPPGRLAFLNLQTMETCTYPDISGGDLDSRVDWQPDGSALLNNEGWLSLEIPCQGEFVPANPPESNLNGEPDPSISPGGAYRAETTESSSSAGILSFTTQLLALPDNQVVNSVEWKIDERLGEMGLGGEWLAGNQFLIYETLDQGPLLVTVAGQVTPVARELFGIQQLPSILGPEGVNLRAAGAAVAGTDKYHIALYGVGTESNFPPVRLYHSDSERVEEMPFRYLWSPAFSVEGNWLLLDELSFPGGYEQHALWIRPVDPEGSPVRFFATGSTRAAWSPSGSQVAFYQSNRVSLYGFPEGEIIGSWSTGAYEVGQLDWSPPGDALAVLGYAPGDWQQALFVISIQ